MWVCLLLGCLQNGRVRVPFGFPVEPQASGTLKQIHPPLYIYMPLGFRHFPFNKKLESFCWRSDPFPGTERLAEARRQLRAALSAAAEDGTLRGLLAETAADLRPAPPQGERPAVPRPKPRVKDMEPCPQESPAATGQEMPTDGSNQEMREACCLLSSRILLRVARREAHSRPVEAVESPPQGKSPAVPRPKPRVKDMEPCPQESPAATGQEMPTDGSNQEMREACCLLSSRILLRAARREAHSRPVEAVESPPQGKSPAVPRPKPRVKDMEPCSQECSAETGQESTTDSSNQEMWEACCLLSSRILLRVARREAHSKLVEDVHSKPSPSDMEAVDSKPSPSGMEAVDSKPSPSDMEAVDSKPSPSGMEAVDSKPSPSDMEAVDSKPSPSGMEAVDSKPSPSDMEAVDSKPSPAKTDVVDSKPTPLDMEAVDSKPSSSDMQAVNSKSRPSDMDTMPDRVKQLPAASEFFPDECTGPKEADGAKRPVEPSKPKVCLLELQRSFGALRQRQSQLRHKVSLLSTHLAEVRSSTDYASKLVNQ